MSEHNRADYDAQKALAALAEMVFERDCFDSKDRERVKKEIDMLDHEDPELRALQLMLPERERILRSLDEKYSLAEHFPTLLGWFAAKHRDYEDRIAAKLDEDRIRRAAAGV
jgi:hypothetical protein